MTPYIPPGWPPGVHPPSSAEFEQTAVAWLLGVVPPDYVLHGVLKRHPVALASLARHHLNACVEGARSGYRTARSELGPSLPPKAVEAVLTAYRSEGRRLADAARAADLLERAMRGEVFVRQLGGARPERSRVPGTRPDRVAGAGPDRVAGTGPDRVAGAGPAGVSTEEPDKPGGGHD